MKRSVIGILAHVDAGKTTLSEAMLYVSGTRDKLGRVDKRNSFLDMHNVERERGITVFSKQAILNLENTEVTLIDTPGHIDFSCEAERALSIQDYAILVVSAPEGPMAHTMTLYNMLSERNIPTFIFVNKTDIAERRRCDIMEELKRAFGTGTVDFSLMKENKERFFEDCAAADENLMEEYFENAYLDEEKIKISIQRRKIIPTIFGSALKCEGVDYLLKILDTFTLQKRYSNSILGAKVYKIGTDPTGARLTYLKITGGVIHPKDTINYIGRDGKLYSEKIEGIRLYSAEKYKTLKLAESDMVVAVTGRTSTYAGLGIGTETSTGSTLEPVLDYKIIFADPRTDAYKAYLTLAPLAEEDPSLAIRYDTETKEIRIKLMGDIQTEVLTSVVKERFGLDISFGEGNILYKETIAQKVYGAGHFEPLMHYAEVRLRLEPLPYGSGVLIETNCPTDTLKTNWQRLILSHLEERAHKGILTGSALTDVKITLIAGKAHQKHTDGGDFREATFRALRQALMKSESILLEPIFEFEIEVSESYIGRVMTDISNMKGECSAPYFENGKTKIKGKCPVFTMRSYAKELRAFTHAEGKITLSSGGYEPCHNADDIIEAKGYIAELDSSVTADSVFCKNGSGYSVPWYEADEKMHTENPEKMPSAENQTDSKVIKVKKSTYSGTVEEDKELMRIFENTYGKIKRRSVPEKRENSAKVSEPQKRTKQKNKGDDYIIIDGYNLIFSWDKLKKLASEELGHARDTLIRILSNYRGFGKTRVIVVFDAHKRKNNEGAVEECGGITVVYTKERQTADAYIEKATYSLAEKNSVRVVTSDYVEQLIILGNGATRVPSREFVEEIEAATEILYVF